MYVYRKKSSLKDIENKQYYCSPNNVFIANESLKGKMGKKFNYHVPTMYVYQKRSSLKDIENKQYY